jgi:hypothetical protein
MRYPPYQQLPSGPLDRRLSFTPSEEKLMGKFLRVIVLVLVLVGVVASTTVAQEIPRYAAPAYVFSILLGFGLGHSYLEDDAAPRFLLLEAGSSVVALTGALVAITTLPASFTSGLDTRFNIGIGMYIAGSLAYGAFRVWEIVDLFGVVRRMRALGKLSMRPALDIAPDGTRVGHAIIAYDRRDA